ncbi:MAG: dockerin [Ruminococcus sp.]|uniref:dockerin type I domain-containing protein n=1 Tax=Ruminococcus sp. TaxID=41978 RepID=UPI0025F9E27E|nr:dockerin type I domain-containing protein [Ruminococcus sp.]MCR5542478.1 dockerin [Ruminococcus sp.]
MTTRLFKCLITAIIASVAAMSTVMCADAYELEKHTQSEIKKMYQKMYFDLHDAPEYSEDYSTEYPTYAGKLEQATLEDGLDSVNFCRYLAGLPYDVELDENYNVLAQNASLVIHINQALSHNPSKPSVMSDDVFALASKGSGESNIGKGYLNIQATVVEGYMYDTDQNNISKLGHRRWVLSPDMQKTGLGMVYDGTAMYVKDKSRKDKFTGDYIAWPPANMPNEFMGNDNNGYAYSVTLNSKIYSAPQRNKVKVALTSKLTGKTLTFDKNSPSDVTKLVGYFNVSDANIASNNNCIIFNPGLFPTNDVLDIKITGIYDKDGKERPISYKVNFFDLLDSKDYTLGFPEDSYEVEIGEPLMIKGYDHPLITGGYRIWSSCEGGGRLRDYVNMIQTGGNIYMIPKKEGVVYIYEGNNETSFDDVWCKVTITHKHTRGNWIVEKKATATEAGYRYKVCSECHKKVDCEVLPATSVAVADIEFTSEKHIYEGSAVQPKINVYSGGKHLTEGTDYTVSYQNNNSVGTARLTIKGKGYFSGTKTVDFQIVRGEPMQLTKLDITVKTDGHVYTGDAIEPKVTIKDGSYNLQKDKDYTVQYSNNKNIGTGKVTITGKGDYQGSKSYTFKIQPADISYSQSFVKIDDVRYSGKHIKINFKLSNPVSGAAMVEGRDYTVSYKNNVNIGTATITVVGIGNYSGTAEINFNIVSPEDYNGSEERDDVIEIECNTAIAINGGDISTEVTFICESGEVVKANASSDGTVYADLPEGEYVVWVVRNSCRPAKTMLTVGSTLASANVKIYKYGDINRDGKINVSDITQAAAFIKGKRLPKDDEQFELADVNRDSRINITDITKIAAHIKGIKLIEVDGFVIPELEGLAG